jgi:hypothetical protein
MRHRFQAHPDARSKQGVQALGEGLVATRYSRDPLVSVLAGAIDGDFNIPGGILLEQRHMFCCDQGGVGEHRNQQALCA